MHCGRASANRGRITRKGATANLHAAAIARDQPAGATHRDERHATSGSCSQQQSSIHRRAEFGNHLLESGLPHRLDEVTVEAGFHRSLAIFVLPPSRNGNEGHVSAPRLLANLPGHFETIRFWKSNVEQY